MEDAAVYLVPIGSGRFELYTEPIDDASAGASARDGFWRRQMHGLHERWRQATRAAHSAGASTTRLARGRDWLVRRVVESIAEQRTLWSLRGVTSAALVYPDDLSSASAAVVRERMLAHSRRHHGRWLLANLAGSTATVVLFLLPGPNLIGYYFAFRVIGHYLAWCGARQALDRTSWHGRPEPALTALGALAHLPREERADQVERLAAGLHLPRLAAFFESVTLPPR